MLALVLRSLVAPLYLILSVVLSYLASLGVPVIVFMKIGGDSGIVFLLPVLMFIFLLALGEDYNILVMTRIREEASGPPVTPGGGGRRCRRHRTDGHLGRARPRRHLRRAGGGRRLGPGERADPRHRLRSGVVGILLDTFVVRTLLVPATVMLLGRWNWWPSKTSRWPEPAPAP